MPKKKYSLVQRQKFHENRIRKVVEKHSVYNGPHSKMDIDAINAEISKSKKLQYSDGYTASRSVNLNGQTPSFVAGYNAARRAEEKSRNIKF